MYYIIISVMNMLKTLLHRFLNCTILLLFVSLQLVAQNSSEVQLANQYLQQGENEKAFLLYEKLEKNPKNIPLIHNNYFQLLLMTSRFDQAIKYCDNAIKTAAIML